MNEFTVNDTVFIEGAHKIEDVSYNNYGEAEYLINLQGSEYAWVHERLLTKAEEDEK